MRGSLTARRINRNCSKVYPRECGAALDRVRQTSTVARSIPASAGQPPSPLHSQRYAGRSIPASAGQPGTLPRVCGQRPLTAGLSPRVRGSPLPSACPHSEGLSPRVRGSPISIEHAGLSPRVRGSQHSLGDFALASCSHGLSPRVRGSRCREVQPLSASVAWRVYPRECGAAPNLPGDECREGSIPASAGQPIVELNARSTRYQLRRSIPASAGQPRGGVIFGR